MTPCLSLVLLGLSCTVMGGKEVPGWDCVAVKRRLSVPLPRKDGGRVFVKRPDPHEEALTILRGQMSPPVAAPGTQVRGWGWWGPGGTEDTGGPLGEPLCTVVGHLCGDRSPERPWPW